MIFLVGASIIFWEEVGKGKWPHRDASWSSGLSFLAKLSYCLAPAATAARLLLSCPTLCNPRDDSPPGSPIPGILQARTLEWVAISFSSAWKGKVKVKSLSGVRLLATPWTAAYQAPPSMGFSRQEYWSGVPFPSPVGLHTTVQLQLLRRYWLGHRLGLLWYWMVCLGNE